jgi:hypothetical protein
MADVKTEHDAETAHQEGEKLYFDSMKHLTTLNTGSILLLVTFLENLFRQPRWRPLIAVTLVSFVLSTLCSVSSMLQSANYVKHSGRIRDLEMTVRDLIYYLSLATFLLGLASLVVFALRNLY